jgi:hypothetical protein
VVLGYSVCSAPSTACNMKLHGLPLLQMLESSLIATEESSMPLIFSYTELSRISTNM